MYTYAISFFFQELFLNQNLLWFFILSGWGDFVIVMVDVKTEQLSKIWCQFWGTRLCSVIDEVIRFPGTDGFPYNFRKLSCFRKIWNLLEKVHRLYCINYTICTSRTVFEKFHICTTGGVPNKNQKTLFGKCSYWAFLFLLGAPAKKLFFK